MSNALFRILFFLLLFSYSSLAHAVTRVDITRGNMEAQPVALYRIISKSPEYQRLADDILQVIQSDLEHSGLFRAIDNRAFIEKFQHLDTVPQYASWRQIRAVALLVAELQVRMGGYLEIQFRLWDPYGNRQFIGKSYTGPMQNWRRIGHRVADDFYQQLTGEKGYFDTQIAYVSESGPTLKRTKRVAIMDQDGANHRFITTGGDLVLTPRFSPNVHELLYMSFANKKPRVYYRELSSGRERVLGDFPGMSFAPRFSPDGRTAIMSVSENGNSDIYALDLVAKTKRRLTHDYAIDTSPSYSPDGKQIVFNSDRGGSMQLYVMGANGENAHRISFGTGRYAAPEWSPRGDYIAFTKIASGLFYIGVMRPDGSGERLLASGYIVEGPTWAPNGRVIMFTRQEPSVKGKSTRSRLYSIDLTGYHEREIPTPLEASDPAWSPLLQEK
jgi:TolB protein